MTADASGRLAAALADRYRIERELGTGGMATIYLAQDRKHDRKVAVKVLKPELAAVLGADRFVLEIKTTAALQHPHILPLFDSGTADGFLYYVMPYVEGETLRDKLNRETQLSIDEAVRITRDVADALDYAHRHGVIHRDIKPENILLHDGRPVVADFGIALALSAAAGGRMTETGMSLGTPHYMSPEQATADKEITGRSDIYSLGSVLYEMLTGQPPHLGGSAQQIIMKIIAEPVPPVSTLRRSVPPHVAAAVAQSLEKLPADRFASAAAFAAALADPAFRGAEHLGAGAALHGPPQRAFTAVTALAALLFVLALWGWLRPRPSLPVIRYGLALPAVQGLMPGASAPTPAPDGSFLIYTGPGDHGQQLWIKRRDRYAATPIPGTDGAQSFALSPDGTWIAFTGPVPGPLRKIPVGGGSAVTLVPDGVAISGGVAWLDDGTIVFPYQSGAGLGRVSANGGTASVALKGDTVRTVLPSALPGGRGVLFAACTVSCLTFEISALDFRTKRVHRVITGSRGWASYLSTGHVAYVAPDGGLFAVPFDLDHMEVTGSPIAISDSLSLEASAAVAPFHVSASGALVMTTGGADAQGRYQMVWVDRAGRETPLDTGWTFQLTTTAANHGWALSPDGSRLAIGLSTGAGDDIWVKPLPRGPVQRMTYDSGPEYRPRWTADSRFVTFLANSGQARGFYRHRADGSGRDSLLLAGNFDEGAVSPDGRWYLFRRGAFGSTAGGRDIVGFRPGSDSTVVPVLATPYDEESVALSPDGRWLAYQSDETGRTEVFLRPFPNVDSGKQQVSSGGGTAPLWSRDGRELFYFRGDSSMMAVRVAAGTTLQLGQPAVLFRVPGDLLGVETAYYTPWDVGRDGRFLMARRVQASGEQARAIIVVENWLEEWRRTLKP